MLLELFTSFPYFQVGKRIFDKGRYTVDSYKKSWPNNKITQLWYYYEQGLSEGNIKPVNNYKDNTCLKYLEKVTPYPRADIMYWLRSVQDLAIEGKIDADYYTGKKVAANPLSKMVFDFNRSLDDAGNSMRYILITGAVLVGGYFLLPIIISNKMRKKIL